MSRAQSEVTSEILLVAVVVVSVSVFGVAYLDSVGMDRPTLAELSEESDRTDDSVELAHAGGQTLTNKSVRIILRDDSSSVTLSLTDGEVLNRTDDDRLEPGDVWRWDDWGGTPLTGSEVDVLVATDDRILLRTTKTRP
jgi:FlaG/FlaF family flagellin (archaellin)